MECVQPDVQKFRIRRRFDRVYKVIFRIDRIITPIDEHGHGRRHFERRYPPSSKLFHIRQAAGGQLRIGPH